MLENNKYCYFSSPGIQGIGKINGNIIKACLLDDTKEEYDDTTFLSNFMEIKFFQNNILLHSFLAKYLPTDKVKSMIQYLDLSVTLIKAVDSNKNQINFSAKPIKTRKFKKKTNKVENNDFTILF